MYRVRVFDRNGKRQPVEFESKDSRQAYRYAYDSLRERRIRTCTVELLCMDIVVYCEVVRKKPLDIFAEKCQDVINKWKDDRSHANEDI